MMQLVYKKLQDPKNLLIQLWKHPLIEYYTVITGEFRGGGGPSFSERGRGAAPPLAELSHPPEHIFDIRGMMGGICWLAKICIYL